MNKRPRAVTLLLVLVSLVLLAALIAPLATLSGVQAVESAQRAAALRHRLAADAVVAVLPQFLAQDSRLERDLDRGNRAHLALDLEDLHVEVLLQDDTAKLPVPLLRAQRGSQPAQRALRVLQTSLTLPPLALQAALLAGGRPAGGATWRWSGCLEDLFAAPTDQALYGRPGSATAWTQYLTPLGQAVHAFRAEPAVLEAALADLQPGLGLQVAQARQRQVRPNLEGLLDGLELTEAVRRAARQRLTEHAERYSLLVRTRLADDVRQRYVLCTAAAPPHVLLDWEVAP